MQSDMLTLKDQMIQSYERGNIVCNDYAKQLKKQTRIKKVWKIIAISFISFSMASIIYIAI
jgi:ribosome-binding protein aMBF1 (putative translation factor)